FGLADFQDLRLRQTWSRRVELQDLGLRHLALLFPHFGQNSMITVQLFKVFPKRSTQSRANLHTFLCKPPLRGPKAAARGSGNRKSPPKQGVRGTARSPARIGRWYKGSSRSLAALFQKGSGMAVEILSPRTIRARSIWKDLSGEKLRELARAGEKTTEYGSPVYFTRIKNRSAKNTYIVADNVTVGVMQQPIEPKKALETVRQVQDTLAEMDLIQVDRRMGENPEATLRCRLYVPKEYARIAFMWHNMLFPSDSSYEPDFIS